MTICGFVYVPGFSHSDPHGRHAHWISHHQLKLVERRLDAESEAKFVMSFIDLQTDISVNYGLCGACDDTRGSDADCG
jgi:hypothetical protein